MLNLISNIISISSSKVISVCLPSKDYMPFSDIYVSTLKKDIEYSQLLVQSVMALQTNKFIQVTSTNTNTSISINWFQNNRLAGMLALL